ncbi:PREDICTED: alpha-N-acetylneuraminide alpha-2,8-sialyltransferase-like isoform X1 [Branchiostoma belcheri]|uniref:Alpha-N-acetylneuraminide alpha-2,8-sialyltransferase-like isoform X1 n=1 Tax=Branchiostoma belcheri TaxID=7741 RepID=A0A6P5ACG6_BRABE|nr:PREDICTED: alpha-N-acetylneuraminide alpha-2,8-sialyltransferase-like isoform X1 [Branchiostoma belcheri]XP_019639464.1 PREDICTED: alpha-N-acetylneuraminide alpha-2,8-sialyltransferase-like isoform X1 [Branchiostoma belcheri]XP_019639465.1 PREDICTED: alpha-N-acetylneuraminide alpha-2,8-sialyltransferase-like isoform X1 [Branchiostoma belcheri]XP_019639466.1 PREDICTED: alpha-N-acetylneuraminide alpha-2,8-sialyltransferase-like isoform X1 [Branchiostoma belcheri]
MQAKQWLLAVTLTTALLLLYYMHAVGGPGWHAVMARKKAIQPTAARVDALQPYTRRTASTVERKNLTFSPHEIDSKSLFRAADIEAYPETCVLFNKSRLLAEMLVVVATTQQPTTAPVDVGTLGQELLLPWQQNRTASQHLMDELNNCTSTQAEAILTRANTRNGQNIRYYIQHEKTYQANRMFYNTLPRTSPLPQTPYRRCSVVGNGAVLLGRRCGAEIDKADFVFRSNLPPLTGNFTRDTGRKANWTTANPISQLNWRFNLLSNKPAQKEKFVRHVRQYSGLLWVSAFGVKAATTVAIRAQRVLREKKLSSLAVVYGNPRHFAAVRDFWAYNGLSMRLSTGIYLTTIAMTICDEVHLFGFWPFDVSHTGEKLLYHYYDKPDTKMNPNLDPAFLHNLPKEFLKLVELHRRGVLKIHLETCQQMS